MWSEVQLRGAGFDASWLDELTSPELARRVEQGDNVVALRAEFDAVLLRLYSALRVRARDRRFLEALVWQNRRALHDGVGPLLRHGDGPPNSKDRQKLQLVAIYLQRYCAKNEMASFFGSTSPGLLVAEGPTLALRVASTPLARRRTYFEPWAIDALGERLTEDPEFRAELAPRKMPTIRQVGTAVYMAAGINTLPPDFAEVLAACDGVTPAREIAARLAGRTELGLETAEDVFDMLEELANQRLIRWTLDVPTTGGQPEVLARATLMQLRDSPARQRAIAMLDELDASREAVSQGAGDPDALDQAIDGLEGTFTRLTGREAVRNHGKTYAGRTIVGEDCRRGAELSLGPALWERLSAPIELVLNSARWFTHEIAARYRVALDEIFARLNDGSGEVEYVKFAREFHGLFPGPRDDASIVKRVADEAAARWWRIASSSWWRCCC